MLGKRLLMGLLFLLIVPFASLRSSFWESSGRQGVNFFNAQETESRWKAASQYGFSFIRLTPSKWKSTSEANRFFLMKLDKNGHYKGLEQGDVDLLKKTLDMAHKYQLKVELTLLDLPHHIWAQHNNGVQQRDIFLDEGKRREAISFIADVAQAIKDHPAIVGFNPLNEPSPEKLASFPMDWYSEADVLKWSKEQKETLLDLNRFNREVVFAIREKAKDLSLILDSGFYGTPWAFKYLIPLSDPNVLYAFHFYEPFSFTSRKNKDLYSYPGIAPIGEGQKKSLEWNKKTLSEFLEPIRDWQKKFQISSNKILVEEFGVYRKNKGAALYMKDLMDLFQQEKWHRAFYSFREDEWDGMDYELGDKAPFKGYWMAKEKGKEVLYPIKIDKNNPFSCLFFQK